MAHARTAHGEAPVATVVAMDALYVRDGVGAGSTLEAHATIVGVPPRVMPATRALGLQDEDGHLKKRCYMKYQFIPVYNWFSIKVGVKCAQNMCLPSHTIPLPIIHILFIF